MLSSCFQLRLSRSKTEGFAGGRKVFAAPSRVLQDDTLWFGLAIIQWENRKAPRTEWRRKPLAAMYLAGGNRSRGAHVSQVTDDASPSDVYGLLEEAKYAMGSNKVTGVQDFFTYEASSHLPIQIWPSMLTATIHTLLNKSSALLLPHFRVSTTCPSPDLVHLCIQPQL